jgi:hypothetical protein
MWNLVKGKSSFHTRLASSADCVRFSSSGAEYAILFDTSVSLHSAAGDGGLKALLRHDRKAVSLAFYNDDVLLTGAGPALLKPIGYTWSYLAYIIGHLVPVWHPLIGASFHFCWPHVVAFVLQATAGVDVPRPSARTYRCCHCSRGAGRRDCPGSNADARICRCRDNRLRLLVRPQAPRTAA